MKNEDIDKIDEIITGKKKKVIDKKLILIEKMSDKFEEILKELKVIEKDIPENIKNELVISNAYLKDIKNRKIEIDLEPFSKILEKVKKELEEQKIENKRNSKKIIEAIENIKTDEIVNEIKKIPNNKDNTDKIIKSFENEIKKVKPIDSGKVLTSILKKLEDIKKDSNKVKKVDINRFPDLGITNILNGILSKLSNILNVKVVNEDKREPIPVVLVDKDKKRFYNAMFSYMGGGGGYEIVGLKDKTDNGINPATEDKQDDIITHLPYEANCNTLRVADCYALIAEDRVDNHIRGSIIGSQDAIGTAGFAILTNATATQPSTNTQMQVVSDSVEDDAGGTGALEVTITYLPSAWGAEFKTETVVLNGTTTVDTIATDIYRIESFIVNKANGVGIAVGTITLKSTDGVTLYAQIDAGRNFFERAIHYVRTGYRAVVTGVIVGCSTNGGVIWRLFRSTEDSEGNVIPLGRYSIEVADSTLPYTANMPIVCANPNGKRMAVGLAVLGRNANQKGTGSCRFYDALV